MRRDRSSGRRSSRRRGSTGRFRPHGWLGLGLIAIFWYTNWNLPGLRTHWGFFPLWLGYCLLVDALAYARTGTSLLTRSRQSYVALFLLSAPSWWLFEAINLRTQNWWYVGADQFEPAAYAFWTTLSFTTVMPAVFGTAELFAGTRWLQAMGAGPKLGVRPWSIVLFFMAGWLMLALLLVFPSVFFPLVWLSVYFIIEPINVWLGHLSLATFTREGDWRPVIALWCGVLTTAFFWEMWNYWSFPKWAYQVPGISHPKLFEMPLPGYGGYLPFALELAAIHSLLSGALRPHDTDGTWWRPLGPSITSASVGRNA